MQYLGYADYEDASVLLAMFPDEYSYENISRHAMLTAMI
jgi:hypothetical protein